MNTHATGSFSSAITAENQRGLIAVVPDIKCVSPKEGDLLRGRNPVETAVNLVNCGAPALSVVTERVHFGGSPELLRAVAQAVGVPVLRKDFITDEIMLEETAVLGAKAVLLICAAIDENKLASLYEKAIKIGLEPLVEINAAGELERANRLGTRLIGINNRDIITLEKDGGGPSRTARLAPGVPAGTLLISESGILSPEDAHQAAAAGADAILVGTALWQADDMNAIYQSFRVERRPAHRAQR